MSADFGILIASAVMAAYGTHAAIRLKVRLLPTVVAVVAYAYVGMHSVLMAILTGDGRIFPGTQLSPTLRARWGDLLAGTPLPHPGFVLLALGAHALVLLPKPDRMRLWRPMPATLVFLVLFLALNDRTHRGPTRHQRARRPDATAFLTVVPAGGDEQTRLVIAEGAAGASFLNVRFVHEAQSPPPRHRLFWTVDGKGLVLMILREPMLALDLDGGETIGGLPEKSHEWPRQNMASLSVETRAKLSRWRKQVDDFVKAHGGLLIE